MISQGLENPPANDEPAIVETVCNVLFPRGNKDDSLVVPKRNPINWDHETAARISKQVANKSS